MDVLVEAVPCGGLQRVRKRLVKSIHPIKPLLVLQQQSQEILLAWQNRKLHRRYLDTFLSSAHSTVEEHARPVCPAAKLLLALLGCPWASVVILEAALGILHECPAPPVIAEVIRALALEERVLCAQRQQARRGGVDDAVGDREERDGRGEHQQQVGHVEGHEVAVHSDHDVKAVEVVQHALPGAGRGLDVHALVVLRGHEPRPVGVGDVLLVPAQEIPLLKVVIDDVDHQDPALVPQAPGPFVHPVQGACEPQQVPQRDDVARRDAADRGETAAAGLPHAPGRAVVGAGRGHGLVSTLAGPEAGTLRGHPAEA
mmetsp:Transcript_35487/g.101328  ORF Transcript_35487/g.101328 Transcript_35487/m.101328 type:complete len:314 (+) Transcript_35487:510-1451(+)